MFYEPTPHQSEDSDAMLEYRHALLWADAGTGKTVTAMEAFRKGGYEKLIVICPKLALTMWKEELEKHLSTPEKKFVVKVKNGQHFTNKDISRREGIYYADALVTTFGVNRSWMNSRMSNILHLFSKGGMNIVKNPGFRQEGYRTALIIDEAHNLKSYSAAQTRAVFGHRIKPVPDCAQWAATDMWQLTGTPVTRYFNDLWTQLRAARPEILQHYGVYEERDFINKFCVTKLINIGRGGKQRVVCGNTNHALLEKLLADCKVIRRKLSDVVDNLPPVTHRVVAVGHGSLGKGRSLAGMSEANLIRELNDPDSEMAKTRRLLGTTKVKDIAEYVREYARRPFLIGFWHKEVGAELMDALTSSYDRLVIVDGSTPSNVRDMIREDFNAGKIDGIIGQMQAMNTSWNLQEACAHVIIAEELPSPAMLHQFYSRVYRRGQKNHVQVDHMRSEHSLDVALCNIRNRKAADNERLGL